jgi:hypothetical protein
MSNDRYTDFRAGMARKDTDLNSLGLKKEPNNRKNWDKIDTHQPFKKKVVEAVLPAVNPAELDWLNQL